MSDDALKSQQWTTFYNAGEEVIPSYAVVNFVSDKDAPPETVGYLRRMKAKQFASDDDQGVFALNSRVPVQPGKWGECTLATDAPAFARLTDTDVTDPDIHADDDWLGMEWGPVDGKWSIGPDGKGYIIVARPDPDNNRVLVLRKLGGSEITLIKYKPDETKIIGSFTGENWVGVGQIVTDRQAFEVDEDEENEVIIHMKYVDSTVLFPGMTAWCVRAGFEFDDKPVYWAFSGGVSFFLGKGRTNDDDAGNVIPVWNSTEYDPVDATAFCGELLGVDQSVGVQVSANVLYVTVLCCPVPEDDA